MLGLLRLPKEVQDMVVKEELTMGHARVLSKLDDPMQMIEIAEKVVEEKIPVRELEELTSGNKFEKKVKIKDKYLLTYFLGDVSNELLTFIKTTAKENKLEIVNLYDSRFCPSTKKEKKEYAFSPSEFLWLVDNCEFFITDSYHGCVFSTIFEKPFRWFARKQDNQCDMNCRIKTLFLKLGLGDCCVGDINEKICNIQNIDYSLTKKHIEDEQKIVYDFLERAFT